MCQPGGVFPMFIRSKVAKGATYYQVVHGYRDESGRGPHRTVASLGREPTAEGALAVERARAKSLNRMRSRVACISNPPAALKARVEALDRQIAAATAKVELLSAIADGSHDNTVDTTPGSP